MCVVYALHYDREISRSACNAINLSAERSSRTCVVVTQVRNGHISPAIVYVPHKIMSPPSPAHKYHRRRRLCAAISFYRYAIFFLFYFKFDSSLPFARTSRRKLCPRVFITAVTVAAVVPVSEQSVVITRRNTSTDSVWKVSGRYVCTSTKVRGEKDKRNHAYRVTIRVYDPLYARTRCKLLWVIAVTSSR